MNPFHRELDRIEEDLRPYTRTLAARGSRFLTAFLPAFLGIIISSLTEGSALTIPLLWSTALSVTVTVLGETDPSIRWSAIVGILDRARYRSDEPLTVKQPPTSPRGGV